MISVLLPTRGRQEHARASLASLWDNASYPEELELLVRVDKDEPTFDVSLPCQVISGPRYGYGQLHLYYNEMAEKALGDWLMIWNDDAVMNTPGWDDKIRQAPNGLRVLDTGGFLFPLMSRKLYTLLGHVSLNAHNDSWLEAVGKGADIAVKVPLDIVHTKIADKTSAERDESARISSPEFFGPECQELIRKDVEKVRCAK